ncbi:hypothetical protein L218DRAFT_956907 [Marasmius fiardii PR-910]|nr:hypothetical protein L218DRAFT_956907 [Marasmius fiardii PR-910]
MKKGSTIRTHSNIHIRSDTRRSTTSDIEFRIPEIPPRVQTRASSSLLSSDLDPDNDVLIPSSQPPHDLVEWQASQTPSLRKMMEDAKSVKRRAIKTAPYHEQPTSTWLPTEAAKDPQLPQSCPPLADCVKTRNQNDNSDQRASSSKSVEGLPSMSEDRYFTKLETMMKQISKDMERNQEVAKERGKIPGKGISKGKLKADRKRTWGGGIVGRVEKQRRGIHGGLGLGDLARVEGSRRVSLKGKEKEETDVFVGDIMDVDKDEGGTGMDVDLGSSRPSPPRPSRSGTRAEPLRSVSRQSDSEDIEPPPPRIRGQASIASTSDHQQSSASTRITTTGRRNRDREIQRALSFTSDGVSASKPSAATDDRRFSKSSSSSLLFSGGFPAIPSPSSNFPSIRSNTSYSFDGSSRDLGSKSSRSNHDSVYGSLPIHTKEQGASKNKKEKGKEKETIPPPSSSPFVVPGLNHAKKAKERDKAPERASVKERPSAQTQEAKPRSGPPILGMMRRHNLPSSSASKSFKAPFKKTDPTKRLEDINKGLEKCGDDDDDDDDDDDGPDIHEGEADSSNYSALDISMNSDMADELNKIEEKYSQDHSQEV